MGEKTVNKKNGGKYTPARIKAGVARRLKRKTKKVNVLLVEIINRNLGDTVIADTAMYLSKKALPFLSRKKYCVHHYNVYSEDYEAIRLADMIIFDGGGIIKYKREEFYLYISRIIEKAQQYNVPVFFNGVGVEGYNAEDEKCQMLKKALNEPCVKGISIRDDMSTLLSGYLTNKNVQTFEVADPAVFTPEVYGIKRDTQSKTIGLGVVRYRIFEDHDMPEISRQFQLDMWKETAEKLEQQGYEWKLFVNGLKSDFDFAEEVLEYMGKENEREKYLVPRPVESRELVETIASFQGIIACRMHANIVAYSLGVPSVGLVWNDKLTFWGEKIGYPERFLKKEDFLADKIVAAMDNSVKEGVRKIDPHFKNSVFPPLKQFMHTYGKPVRRERQGKKIGPVEWNTILVASAMGGKCLQYSNMNTPVTIDEKFKAGFRQFEADLRLTTDNKLVCVNGWSKMLYKKLGLLEDACDGKGLSYEEFMNCKMYDGHYPVMDFVQLMDKMNTFKTWSLIIDIGKPDDEKVVIIRDQLTKFFNENPEMKEHITIRLQTRKDVAFFRGEGHNYKIMFYMPAKETRDKYDITVDSVERFCKKNKIKWVSLSKEAFDSEVDEQLKKSFLKVCVFSYSNVGDILDAIHRGADMIGTHFATVDGVRYLTNGTLGQ